MKRRLQKDYTLIFLTYVLFQNSVLKYILKSDKQLAQYQLILNVIETWFELPKPFGICIRINNVILTIKVKLKKLRLRTAEKLY